ncbi:MAG: amidohydrolase family protein [Promicromonosporaceae bacterium]|nr:amidohydrolase family protein [Promicromonosporaceae bacterium]
MADSAKVTVLRGKVVLPTQVIDDGIVLLVGDRIGYAGPVVPAEMLRSSCGMELPTAIPEANANAVIMPGLIDLHNHGGGGASFPDATTAEQVEQAANTHLRAGTTTMLASLVTADPDTLVARCELLAQAAEKGVVAGIHIEGPFLSRDRRGAQSPDFLSAGNVDLVKRLITAGGGWLRTMTVAPEIEGVTGPGGAAEALTAAGVIPSLGHTDATCEQAEALIAQVAPAVKARGLRMTATHLFNGMPPLHHRAPGPIAACLAAAARGDMVVEMIGDGVHLDPATVRSFFPLVNGNAAFITDAMAAAGMPDGEYQLGPMAVQVSGGVARLATKPGEPEGAIAGGTARLIDVVRISVNGGIPLADAVRAASWVPASVLNLTDVGGLIVGRRADVLITDAELKPVKVFRAGQEISS